MNTGLSDTSLHMLKWAIAIGMPSFFLGWFAHCLWDWLMFPPGKGKE